MKQVWINVCISNGVKAIATTRKMLMSDVRMVSSFHFKLPILCKKNTIEFHIYFAGADSKSGRLTRLNENELQRLTNRETHDYSQDVERKSKNIPDYSNVCGRIKVTEDADDSDESIGQFRVISGSRTKRGHHPWQATVRARGRNGRSTHWCGAVIISKTHILTGKALDFCSIFSVLKPILSEAFPKNKIHRELFNKKLKSRLKILR